VTVLGLEAARRHAGELCEKAQAALARSSLGDVTWLAQLADRVVDRDC
jgi:farnesyl diphosphate synthase